MSTNYTNGCVAQQLLTLFLDTSLPQTLVDIAPLLGEALDQTALSFFCDKAGRVFMPRFHDAVGSIKRWEMEHADIQSCRAFLTPKCRAHFPL